MKQIKTVFTFYSSRGVTLTELLITVAIIGFVVAAMAMLFQISRRAFTSFEAANKIKTVAQQSSLRIATRLNECKRIFENTSADLGYLNRISTGSPAVLTGSTLPMTEENGSLSPATTSFVRASVGNRLFFANTNTTQKLENITGTGSSTHTVRLDTYCFNYYYLTDQNGMTILNRRVPRLIEWHSIEYVDFNQLASLSTDNTLRINTIVALYNRGFQYAWNPSATDVTTAFYAFTITGSTSVVSSPTISESSWRDMTSIVTGIMGIGYPYGISPNTGSGFSIVHTIPQYATANNLFPSGFEIMVIGPSISRTVYFRLVMVAQIYPNVVAHQETALCSTRDLW